MNSKSPILDGLRVIEAASMIMVPSVGAMLAEFGAEVIKVEPLEGDLNRRGHRIPGMPDHDYEYCFLPDNRNKKSLALDLKQAEGRDILYRLIDDADVFLTNYRPKALERLRLRYPDLKARNSRLIYAHGTGFGDDGREADKPGFDAVCYYSRSGLEATMFPLEGWLGPLGYGTGDHPSGMALFGSVMLALLSRQSTDRGCRVTTSLIANGAWSNAVLLQARLCEATFHERRPREEARNFTGVYYRAADERIFKMTVVDGQQGWPRVCRAIGRPELIDDPRYASAEARADRMPELIALCDEIFAGQPIDYWKQALEENDVPYSVISSYDEVVTDQQMHDNRVFIEVDDPDLGTVRTTQSPLSVGDHPKVVPRTAPRLGQQSREILALLAFDEETVADLFERRVVR